MKTKLLVFALLLGIVGIAESAGRSGQGWNVSIVTGTSLTIGGDGKRVFLNKIVLSSDTTAGVGNYLMAFSTQPNLSINGSDATLFGGPLFQATAAVIPALVYQSTASVSSIGSPTLNTTWSMGDCDICFIEIQGTTGALNIRKSANQSGQAVQAAVYWSH